MKSIMYHYIQEYNNDSPYFNFLNVKDFEKQILYFKEKTWQLLKGFTPS